MLKIVHHSYIYISILTRVNVYIFSYAYTGRPVVAVSNSEQSGDFGFKLFKNLSNSNLLRACQFFPYKTEFNTLEEALNMDEQRAAMAPGYAPWYIGW